MRADQQSQTDYERLGGEEGLRRILDELTERVYRDPIIGFLFEGVDRDNLIAREVEFAAQHLGGPQAYRGKPIGPTHKARPINRGHFHRRLWLLEQTLRGRGVDEGVIDRWLAHNRALERVVTNGTDCTD